MNKNYLYSVTDKALFEALNTSKITNSELRDLFLSRGVIISLDTDREDLARTFSKYNHDYYDHQRIASAMGVIPRKEKSTISDYITEIDKESVENILNKLKDKIELDKDLCIWHESENGNLVIDINYITPDYTKSEFKQIVNKEAQITIETNDSGYTLRYPDNARVKEYEKYIREAFQEENLKQEKEFDFNSLNLATIESPELRTKFFNDLLYNMDGYKVTDVTDVYVFHPKPTEEEKKKSGDSGIHISRASLKGEGVLQSGELQEFYDRGFYISKIRWKFEEELIGSDIYEAEVMFGDPENFTDFSYIDRGKYKYKTQGQYNKNPSKLDQEEELFFSRLIENNARDIINSIIEESIKED